MIRPTKYIDLKTCILHIAGIILDELKRSRIMPLRELDLTVKNTAGQGAGFNFIHALNFLFLLGKIDYDDETDSVLFLDISR